MNESGLRHAAPIGFAAMDLDFYSSTATALGMLRCDDVTLLRRVALYFDNVNGVYLHRFARSAPLTWTRSLGSQRMRGGSLSDSGEDPIVPSGDAPQNPAIGFLRRRNAAERHLPGDAPGEHRWSERDNAEISHPGGYCRL